MVLNIAALLFVLGITFVHSLFGLYSGLINVFCCLASLAVAFGYFEALNDLLTGRFHLHPAYTEPLSLVLLYVITHVLLRVVADRWLRGNVRVPAYLDWVGGALCGLFIGQVTVGIMVLGFLMLPWGERVLLFSGLQRDPENRSYSEVALPPEQRRQDERAAFIRNRLWLRSDQFAAGVFGLLSGGSLRGPTAFPSVYPSFPDWVVWTGNTVQRESSPVPYRDESGGDGFARGIAVESWWEQTGKLSEDFTRYRKVRPGPDDPKPAYQRLEYKPMPGRKLIGVRLVLRRESADRSKGGAYHLFRPSMLRLVGDIGSGADVRPAHYLAEVLGGADANLGDNLRIVDPDNNLGLVAGAENRIDVYFEVDENFTPRFIEYRRHARAPLTAAALAKTAPAVRLAAAGSAGPAEDRASGAARFIDVVNRGASGGTDRLPFVLRLERMRTDLNVTLEGGLLVSGRLAGERSVYEAPGDEAERQVGRFKAPEGRRVFQSVSYTHLTLPTIYSV